MRSFSYKKHLTFPLIFILTLFLTGCHGSRGKDPFVIPEEFNEEANYEITFWAKNDTNITQTKIYEKAISDFEEYYPNIHVNLRLYTDYGKIYNDVITNISTDTTPNVCITYPDHIATYLTGSNVIIPLDEIMEDKKYGLNGSEVRFDAPSKDEIIPKFLEECSINGTTYALPYMRSTEACYINKTYVEALGFTIPDILTWDFIWEVSEAALEKNDSGNYAVNDQKVLIPFIYKSTDNMMIQMLRQRNAGYSDSDGNILIFNDTTKELLKTIAGHANTGAFSTFKISGYPANFLNSGQCIFAIDSTAGSTWMGTNAPLSDISKDKIRDFETEIRPVPQFDTTDTEMISQGPSICVFNKSDNNEVLASWLFVQFMLTNSVQNAYAMTEGYIPVTTKAVESTEYKDYISRAGEDNDDHYDIKIKASTLIVDNIDNTFVTPVFNGSTSLRDASGSLIENVTKSVRRKETVDDSYLDALFKKVNSQYRLDSTARINTDDESLSVSSLPRESKILLLSLLIIWIFIIMYVLFSKFKRKDMKLN
ncbi:MAG: extracellular solute-binding protein [Lachnospiraceae bacterium]|nr:extracellular solute-binding protein [Lachnospiraceae bacterium]